MIFMEPWFFDLLGNNFIVFLGGPDKINGFEMA